MGGPWGAFESLRAACDGVASDVVVLALLPTTMSLIHSHTSVDEVENQVAAVKGRVPPELTADLAWIQLLVDSYGEQLASSGQGDAPAQRPGFDRAAFDAALTPMQDWLGLNCG